MLLHPTRSHIFNVPNSASAFECPALWEMLSTPQLSKVSSPLQSLSGLVLHHCKCA